MEIQLSLFWLNILSIFRVIYSQNENVPAGASSLTFVFDITGSMYDDLVQVIEGAEKIMDTTLARRVNPLYNYILIPFHDPDIGPVIVTRDPEEFIHELQDLYVHGGGDCPEMSVGAIKEAIDISLPNSFIYVFTDARSKDYVLTDDVLSLIQQKQSQVVFVMTGDCGNQTHEGFQAYEKIASTSSGQVFLLKKDQVNQVLDFVKLTVQAQKVNLMSVDSPKKSVNIYTIPVDNKLQEFTVSVTGKAPDIKLWAPGQEIEFTEIDGLTNLLDLKKVKIQNVKEPQPGKWKLQVSSNSSHTVRVHGLSSANFFNGFSRRPVTDISSTTLRPLAGVESYGLVNTSDIDLPAQLYEMELLDLQGNVLARYPLVKDKLRDNIYSISKFEPPESFFYLKVTGIDDEGNSLQRLTATAISSRRPTNPLVYMPDITRGYYDATAFLTCRVISEIPFTVQWSRKQKALGYEQHHSDSSNVTLEVPYATEKSEGLYMCNATNKAGWKATQTFLDVSEPPPSIIPPQNVSALPGEDAIMSCFVFSTVDHNISWYKVGRNLQLKSNRKFHVLNNGSIIIRNIERKDQGKYVCRAGNEGGFTKQSVYVTVQVPPEVTIEPSKQNFQNGRKASFVCVATGYPTPSYYWLRDGELLIPNDRVKIKGSKLTIRHLGRGDEGDYQCLARNPAGESVAVAQLNYIEKPAITLYNKQIMVAVGDPAIMKCSTTGIPPPLVTWYKGDIELTALSYVKISDDGELTILGTQKQDIGKYRCVASNTAGSQSITTQLTVGSAPRITGPPLNTGADIGTNTTLTCRARGLPRPTIKWNFDGKPVVMTGRFTQLTSGELFIQGILPADEGRYTCIVKNKFGIKEHTAFLSVTGILHPVIAYTVPYIEVITGKNVSFSCVLIQGNPIPTVHWLHKGHMISDGNHYTKDGPDKVSIINIQKQHEGDYTCVATNVAGNSTSVVSVNVQVPPSLNRDETEDKQTNFTVDLGSGVVLPCKVDGDPLPTIVWYKDESPISMTDLHYFIRQDGSLEIFSSYQTDTGEYRCTASNIAGNVEKTVSLFVQVPPTIDGELNEKHTIIEEETITLDCVVNGIPQPNVYWRRNFKRFLPKSDRYTFDEFGLTITRAKTTDRALYECVAENVAGETSKVITVIVQTPPTISNGDPSSITAIQGISVVLNCEPEGDPTPMVVWRKDGVTIDTDSFKFEMIGTGTLMVHDVLVQDAGDYICEAESVAGRVSKEFDLIVHAPPEFPQDLPTKTEVIEGEPVTLVCPAVGTPTPTIVWYKDDRLVSRNEEGITQLADGVLEIDRTKASDAGLYRCEATNVAGSVVREIELDVHVPPKVINGSNVDPNSRNPSVILNSNISLSCPVDGDPPPVVTWYKDGNKIVSGDWSEDGRVLYVTFAMVDDAGRYKCVATNVAGETEVTFDLDVYVPPYIDPTASSQDNITVIENQQLVINCPISGIPLPDITWYKDGHIISPDSHVTITSNGRRLSVTNTGVDNSGDYRCVGENVAGNKEKIFSVKVHVPPSVDRPREVTLTEIILDKDLRITCPATGIPPPKITWFINNHPIKNDTSRVSLLDDGWTLEIRNVQRTDATQYRCKAENEAGQSEKVFDVNILLPSIVIKDRLNLNPKVILNNSLSLSCPVQGNPPPVITWYKNDHMINFTTSQSYERLSEGRQLHIISAGTSDAAVFRCHAENKAGKDDVEFDVEILLPARINMTGINTKPKVLSGTLLTLSCPAVGIPKPNITWYKDGIMLTELTNQLIIDAVDVRDTGKYKCVVRNEAGQSELGFDVKVQVPPSIDIVGIDTNPKVTQGQPHTLICPARGTPPPDITWYKDGQPIDFESEPELMLKANGRRLYFQEVDVKDDGKYKCVASNEAGKSEQDFDLDILVPPTIDESAVDDVSKVVIGHSTSLQCPATGTPIPTIEWYKDGRLLVYSSRIQTENNGRQLNIINATVEDTGNYTCTATNTAGTSSHDMTVLVLVPPSIDESNVIYNPKVHVNRTVLLDCPVEGVPSPDVTWLIDNLPLVETAGRQLLQNNRQLKIQRAQVEDSATYTCQAVNEAGDLSKNFKLTVQLPSKIDRSNLQTSFSIIQNHTVYLNCPVTGSPKPSITWLKDSIPMLDFPYKDLRVLNQDQRLEISNAQVEDAGKYTCRASNVAGSDKQHFELEVKVPPEMTGPRTTTKSTVIVRDPVNLECFVVGVPMPDVTWLKDNKPLDLSENPHIRIMTGGQVLQFVSSLIDDTARFTCRANNSAGLAEKYFDLTVLVPPKVNGSENIQRQSVLINHQHVLDCPASGIPPPKIAWKFRGEVIPEYGSPSHRILNNGGQLLLMNTQLFDAGFYSCIVSNIAGNTSLDFQVEVQVPPTISEGRRHVASVVDTRVRLLCESDGLPKPIVRWEKNGEPFPTIGLRHTMLDKGSLEFVSVQLEDTGDYRCYASNPAGQATQNVTLSVQVRPRMKNQGPVEISVVMGQSVDLPCDVEAYPPPRIMWQLGASILAEYPDSSPNISPNPNYQIVNNSTLRIMKTDISDSGVYICIARNNAGTAIGQVRLQVSVPPKISVSRTEFVVPQGRDIVLPCSFDGKPEPQVTWMKNGIAISNADYHYRVLRSGRLAIPYTRSEDAGTYTCKVVNIAGQDSADMDLIVQVPPTITRDNNLLTSTVGQILLIPCQTSGIPVPVITWLKDSRQIQADDIKYRVETNGTLVIYSLEADDTGSYTCTARNVVGRDSYDRTLRVQVPPTIIQTPFNKEVVINDRFMLKCAATGIPVPTVIWTRNGEPVPTRPSYHGRSRLIIRNTIGQDAGLYTCIAKNPAGRDTASSTVVIKVPPRVTVPDSDTVVIVAEKVLLSCSVGGDPQPDIYWTKNGRPVQLNNRIQQLSNGSLVIYDSTSSDAGNYKCVATNDAGSSEGVATLSVHEPPKLKIEPKNTTVNEGDIMIMNCIAEGEPHPDVAWQRGWTEIVPGGRISILPNNSLRIVASQLSDSGLYRCRASNSLGITLIEAAVTVVVHGRFSDWSDWGTCSKSCGTGIQMRTRQCNDPPPSNGGRRCIGVSQDTRTCVVAECPVNGSWGNWVTWAECSVTCGPGELVKHRECDNPVPSHGGEDCEGDSMAVLTCNVKNCPVDGSWSSWSSYGPCSTTCGEGTHFRQRICDNPPPSEGGRSCQGDERDSKKCTVQICAVDGNWGQWSVWVPCSHSCGGGSSRRTRLCDSPIPQYGGQYCQGRDLQVDYCNPEPCPVNGKWSSWGKFGECSASCDGGFRKRFRTCTDPIPSRNGRPCVGPSENLEPCNNEPCPVHGDWNEWGTWSECSTSCDEGFKERHRVCNIPLFGGLPCVGDREQIVECTLGPCSKMPRKAEGNIVGYINSIDITEGRITALATPTNDGTAINASIYNIPSEVSGHLQHLVSVLNPVYWTLSQEVDGASNGFKLTEGEYSRDTQVQFATGEILKMSQYVTGIDSNGVLQFDVIVRGSVPELPDNADIQLYPYSEDYIQTGPDSIYSYSSRLMQINGHMLPYAWNHTISYNPSHGVMPYLVERLSTKDIKVQINPTGRQLQFSLKSKISPGTRGQCPKGFILNSEGSFCTDEDECSTSSPCSHYCHNSPGSYSCSCNHGYSLDRDGETCKDVDECSTSNGGCGENNECINIDGSFICAVMCKDGYRRSGDGQKCIDKDECRETPEVCGQFCRNIPGGYTCSCSVGFELRDDQSGRCTDINECRVGQSSCSHICRNIIGSYKCDCPPGYRLFRKYLCEDVDECLEGIHECRPEQNCVNTRGSYLCQTSCPNGLKQQLDGSCTDVNECLINRHRCYSNQRCINTEGSYHCQCQQGYRSRGPGQPCLDIDECREHPGICSYKCQNTEGDFDCICPPGQKRLADRKSCAGLEFLEPSQILDTSPPQRRNRRQVCPLGMKHVVTWNKCIDVNECEEDQGVCQHNCTNTIGSFYCICPLGYKLSRDNTKCVDINECIEQNIQCGKEKMCFNQRGDFSCIEIPCPRNYRRDPLTNYCVLECVDANIPCPPYAKFADVIEFRTFALPSGILAHQDLIRLIAYNHLDVKLPRTNFTVLENDAKVDFHLRLDDGTGIVYTLQPLEEKTTYKIKVRARSYDNGRNSLRYQTTFIIHISVSAYPY